MCFVTWCKVFLCVCAVMPVSANGLGISLGFTRFLNKNLKKYLVALRSKSGSIRQLLFWCFCSSSGLRFCLISLLWQRQEAPNNPLSLDTRSGYKCFSEYGVAVFVAEQSDFEQCWLRYRSRYVCLHWRCMGVDIQGGPKKWGHRLVTIILSILNRFKKFLFRLKIPR